MNSNSHYCSSDLLVFWSSGLPVCCSCNSSHEFYYYISQERRNYGQQNFSYASRTVPVIIWLLILYAVLYNFRPPDWSFWSDREHKHTAKIFSISTDKTFQAAFWYLILLWLGYVLFTLETSASKAPMILMQHHNYPEQSRISLTSIISHPSIEIISKHSIQLVGPGSSLVSWPYLY